MLSKNKLFRFLQVHPAVGRAIDHLPRSMRSYHTTTANSQTTVTHVQGQASPVKQWVNIVPTTVIGAGSNLLERILVLLLWGLFLAYKID